MSLVQAALCGQFALVCGEQQLNLSTGGVLHNFRKIFKVNPHVILGLSGAIEDNYYLFQDYINVGNKLGVEGDEGAEIEDAPLSPGVAAVDVDGVAHGLEGVERDADRQVNAQHGHKGQPQRLKGAGDEVPILKKAQQSQVEHH